MKIAQITHGKGGTSITWRTTNGNDGLEHKLESSDLPQKAFLDTLQGFGPMVVDMLGLPEDWKLVVTKLAIKHLGDDFNRHYGLNVVCQRDVPGMNSPLNITTPYVSEDENATHSVMPGDMGGQLRYMLDLARAYVDGDRIKKQPDLPLGDLPKKVERMEPFDGEIPDKDAHVRAAAAELITHGEAGGGLALYPAVLALVIAEKRVSVSLVQRKLGIGYALATYLVEALEERGIVTPPNHVGKREVNMAAALVAAKLETEEKE